MSSAKKKFYGEIIYMYAFDLAYEIDCQGLKKLLGQELAQFHVDSSRRNPKHLFFYRPQMARLPAMERLGPHGPLRIEYAVKLLPIGAFSLTARVPFAVDQIEDLVVYHELTFSNGNLYDEVRQLAENIRSELTRHSTRIVSKLAEEEAYTVFCLNSQCIAEEGKTPNAEDWWGQNRRQVAALLTQEPNLEYLSRQEAEESTGRYLSYYEQDLIVLDWDSALIIDEPKNFDEYLFVLELGNLQLAELEAYDQILDEALESAYRDLRAASMRPRRDVLRNMREIRIDLTRMNDELSNITKFFGDWHLARVYENISARFHLDKWSHSIGNKLKTLDNLYEMLNHERSNRMMLILEVMIVLLFIVDLVILFLGRH